jgi:hypothetical protein
MKFHRVIFLALLLTSTALGDTGLNRQLKEKLKIEVKGLQTEIVSASKDIARLKTDKAALELTLHNMEDWGNSQEVAKLQYYEDAGKLEDQLNKASTALVNEKKRNEEMLVRYRRLKKIMSCLTGGLLTALYVSFGARIIALISPALGPWGFALRYLGPIAVFGLGYLLAFSIF